MSLTARTAWQIKLEERRARAERTMAKLFASESEKREFLRRVLATWREGELREVIESYQFDRLYSKEIMIDEIMSEGMLDDEIDELLMEAIDENPQLAREVPPPYEVDLEITASADCDHLNPETEKPDFDLLDRCRLCARPKAECV